jgi:hypothetical protein
MKLFCAIHVGNDAIWTVFSVFGHCSSGEMVLQRDSFNLTPVLRIRRIGVSGVTNVRIRSVATSTDDVDEFVSVRVIWIIKVITITARFELQVPINPVISPYPII